MAKAVASRQPVCVLTDRPLRLPLKRAIERSLPDLAVIAYTELPADMMFDPVAMLTRDEIFERDSSVEPGDAADGAMAPVTIEANSGVTTT